MRRPRSRILVCITVLVGMPMALHAASGILGPSTVHVLDMACSRLQRPAARPFVLIFIYYQVYIYVHGTSTRSTGVRRQAPSPMQHAMQRGTVLNLLFKHNIDKINLGRSKFMPWTSLDRYLN
eukprot:SAG31_NODE_609_length_13567_cov_18.101574_15_plen_123_part_00